MMNRMIVCGSLLFVRGLSLDDGCAIVRGSLLFVRGSSLDGGRDDHSLFIVVRSWFVVR